MREKNVREINLTKENICFANKISVEDNVIAAECTLLFDVDKYFGTTIKKDNTWISFDVCWTPNGSVHAEYRLRSFDDCCKSAVFFCLKIFFVRENYNSNFPQFYVYQTCMN